MQGDSNSPAEQSNERHLPHSSAELKHINEALRAPENHFREIVNQSDTGIAECDLTGCFVFTNKRFIGITGYTEETLSSMYMQNVIYPDDAAKYNSLFLRLTEGSAFETELRFIRADGLPVWVHIHLSLLNAADGKPFSFIATVRNMDNPEEDIKRWQEEKSLDILDSVTDAFFTVNSNWQFTYINRKAEQLNNRTRSTLLGKVIWDEFPALNGSEYGELYQRVAEHKEAGSVTAVSAVDNQWYEAHAFPAKDGIIAYFKNVTEQKEAEEALRKSDENFRTLFNTIDEGFCIVEILFNK